MDNILEVNNLSKSLGNFSLDNVSFSLKPGYIMGLIGVNGSGKSTTIKLIMNLLKKDSGEIKIFEKDNVTYEKEIKQRIGFVYNENYYYDNLTINEAKKILSPFYKDWDDKIFNNYINQFNLNPNKQIKQLSKGMKIKFSLAMALSHNADLILMDEPTAGIDPVFRREILDILNNFIQNENKSVFFSTHITTDLEKVADYITFIDNGKILFSQNKEELNETYKLIKGPNDILNEDIKNELIGITKNSFGFKALTSNLHKIKDLIYNKCIIETASLEDIMYFSLKK